MTKGKTNLSEHILGEAKGAWVSGLNGKGWIVSCTYWILDLQYPCTICLSLVGACGIRVEQKVLDMDETKWYKKFCYKNLLFNTTKLC